MVSKKFPLKNESAESDMKKCICKSTNSLRPRTSYSSHYGSQALRKGMYHLHWNVLVALCEGNLAICITFEEH